MAKRFDKFLEFERFLRNKSAKEIANLITEYVLESNHQGWDIWDRRDLTGVRRLFEDIMLYYNGADPGHFESKEPPFTGTHFAYGEKNEEPPTTSTSD